MEKQNDRGIFVVLEGIDGVGKSTQIQMLRERLIEAGEEVVISREPTDGPWGRKIREAMVTERMSLEDELQAFVEDRKEHIRDTIQPGLDGGCIVILDRYYFSTIAYQGSRGANVQEIRRRMTEFAPRPDMVFLIDLDPHVSLERISQSRGDVPNAFETLENLQRVRRVFNDLEASDDRIWKVDGQCGVRQIHQSIVALLVEHALKWKRCAEDGGCADPANCPFRLDGTCTWARRAEKLLDP